MGCCSTQVPDTLVDWDWGVVGAAAARSGTADKGFEGFEVGDTRSDRDGL